MQSLPQTEFDWIRSGRKKLLACGDPNWTGNFVSHLFPPGFEAYAKILHSIEAKYDNIDNPLSERENALLNIPSCAKLRSFVESLRKRGENRIRWKSLAELLGVPFQSEICLEWFRGTLEIGCWPRFLRGPAEGTLNAEEMTQILSVLQPFATDPNCFFRLAEIPFVGTEKPILFYGALNAASSFLSDDKYRLTPEYWWPTDHSWCLCSDYDLDFTFVAGPKNLVSAVLNSPILEALEVNPQTRIDSLVPIPK